MRKILSATVIVLVTFVMPASATMTIKEFRKFSIDEQGVYIAAAVSMLAYSTAANGNTAKARCIQDFYFGEPGNKTPGPGAITGELSIAERRDPEKYLVEGVILGLIDKFCGSALAPPKR